MKKPILLNKKDLVEPISKAIERIEKIRLRKESNNDSIILEGLFVLAVSSFENSLNDTLRVLFKHIPGKLETKSEMISKEKLLGDNLLFEVIEAKVIELSYKNLKEYINNFLKITGIKLIGFTNSNDFAKLQEIKASRNLLIHNNLKVNSFYRDTAGKYARKPNINSKLLEIDQEYLFESILTLKKILNIYKDKLLETYEKYTRINAIKNLFDFLFDTPIMSFENEWIVDEERDKIVGYKKDSSKIELLSSSERMFFDIWLAHINGWGKIKLDISFYQLDNDSRKKLGFLMTVIDLLKN